MKMLYFLEKMEKSLKCWGPYPQTSIGLQRLRPQTSKFLLPSFVTITLNLRPIISYLSDGY